MTLIEFYAVSTLGVGSGSTSQPGLSDPTLGACCGVTATGLSLAVPWALLLQPTTLY